MFNEDGFKISMKQTVAVLFTHCRESIQNTFKINNSFVKIKNKEKFLGLHFDAQME